MSATNSGRPLTSVVIVGGGTAGWMTAASLSHRLAHLGVKVTVIESSAIGTVGVGEATVPAIRQYFTSLGLDTFEVMKATSGTFKLGIAFEGWRHEGHAFMHPFGRYGVSARAIGFHHLFKKLREAGDTHPLDAYSLGSQMAWAGRFAEPPKPSRADFDVFDWAVHFDASAFARFLRGFSEARGVRRIDARITEVRRHGETGDIASVLLDTGDLVEGELFIDCSGFRGLLIQGALGAGYRDWSHWLFCDRAVALPCAHADAGTISAYTRARAQPFGWTWRIPLQHRVGNGYVYSSAHISDADAEAHLRSGLEGEALASPNFVRFTPGQAKHLWLHNVVAVGLSGGFLEPLESTSITLIQLGIDKLIQFWPQARIDPRLAAEYNRISDQEYERIRDFIILHYALNGRAGQPFWDACRTMALPDTLQHKIDLFRARGVFVRYDWESFFDPSWLCIYDGLGVSPDAIDPNADGIAVTDIADLAANIRRDIADLVAQAPTQVEAIARLCQSQ